MRCAKRAIGPPIHPQPTHWVADLSRLGPEVGFEPGVRLLRRTRSKRWMAWLVVRPEDHGAFGRFKDRLRVDLGPRLRDASRWPLTYEGERPGRWQRPQPVLHVPGGAATAPAVFPQHCPVWLLALWVVRGVIKGCCLAAVGELHTKAQEVTGQRVVLRAGAVNQVREPLLLSDREVAKAQAEGEGEPGRTGLDAGNCGDGFVGARWPALSSWRNFSRAQWLLCWTVRNASMLRPRPAPSHCRVELTTGWHSSSSWSWSPSSSITHREPPSVRMSKNPASTVEGQKQMSLPPWGPVRKPWTAPGGMKTNMPGPTSSTGSASV
jgi:hypothetical protein